MNECEHRKIDRRMYATPICKSFYCIFLLSAQAHASTAHVHTLMLQSTCRNMHVKTGTTFIDVGSCFQAKPIGCNCVVPVDANRSFSSVTCMLKKPFLNWTKDQCPLLQTRAPPAIKAATILLRITT